MNVTPEEILELFDEAQRLGHKRYRDASLSIGYGVDVVDKQDCIGLAPVLVPVEDPTPGVHLIRWEKDDALRARHGHRPCIVDLHVAPCKVITEPCACGGAWEYREGGRFPVHAGRRGGCSRPGLLESLASPDP